MSSGGPTTIFGAKPAPRVAALGGTRGGNPRGGLCRLEPAIPRGVGESLPCTTRARKILRPMGSRTQILSPTPIEMMPVLAGWTTDTAGNDSTTNATAPSKYILAIAEVCSFGCRQSPTGKRSAGVLQLRRLLRQKQLIPTAISRARAGNYELGQQHPAAGITKASHSLHLEVS